MNNLDLLIKVATDHGAQLKQVGKDYWARCPIHQEKTASFQIKPTGKYICHGGCGGGDAIDLHRAMTGVDYIQAKKDLGLWDNSRPAPRPRPPKPPRTYQSDDRQECWNMAIKTLTQMRDCDITHKGKTWKNYKLILSAIRAAPDRDDLIKRICSDIGGKNWNSASRQNIEIFVNLFLNEAYQAPSVAI